MIKISSTDSPGRNQIEAPAIGAIPIIGAPTVGAPTVVAPAVSVPVIGSSSSATEIGAVVVRWETILYHLEILHSLGQYQFFTPEKTVKHKRGDNEKEDGKRKKAEPRTWQQKYQKIEKKKKGKGKWQKKSNANKKNKKAEEADVPLKKKVQGTKKEAFTDEQFDQVALIELKTLIPKKGLANRVLRKRRTEFPKLENIQSTAKNLLQQVAPGGGLEVVKYLMINDDVEVNLEAISSEYETMVVAEVAKIDIVFFNQEEVVGEAYQASTDEITVISVKEQTLEVEKTEDEASQASTDQTIVVYVEEQTIEVAQIDVSKESKEEVEQNKEEVVEGKCNTPAERLVLLELEVDVVLKKRHAVTDDEINEIAFIMAYQMNQLHVHLDELLLKVLLESFIQRPISQDKKN
ncbi:hypothetical protein GIB67_029347 [Kingdonia uniflora]|uniref:Uncharacterized protein n=1 Tax=Kingdonia uniflora TaxID=39325 RepID=A0A7J7MP94_9MAGN|nr:hypothetical protein GIB67_029347 [Kingdonia uniflora]